MAKWKFWTIVQSIWKHGFNSPYIQQITQSDPVSNYLKGVTGSGLTNAQIEQNDWNSQEAQAQRDWTQMMDNTKYQRQVNDMQMAGLNPAMMYGQGVSATTPSGSAASGGSVGSPSGGAIDSILNLVFAKQRLANLRADEENTKKDTELKGSQISVNDSSIEQIKANIDKIVADTKLSESQSENVAKVTSWLDRMNEATIELQGSQSSYFRKQVDEIDYRIKNLDADTAKKWQELLNLRQEICESYARIDLMNQEAIESSTRASINVDTLDEIAARIKTYEKQAELFEKQSGITQKEMNWMWVDKGLMPGLRIVGTVAGAAAGAGLFAGASPYAGFTPSYMGRKN